MGTDRLYDPLKYYEDQGRQEHEQNTLDYFEDLVKKSGIDVEENRQTVREYDEENKKISEIGKKISRYKTLRVFLIIGMVLGTILLVSGFSGNAWLIVIGVLLAAACTTFLFWKVNPIIKDASSIKEKYEARAAELLAEAEAQMAPLNVLFDERDTYNLIEKTIPEMSFEEYFTNEQRALFINKYDYVDMNDDESSVTDTVSGKFVGNPFILSCRHVHEMGTHTYQGSLTITWTETYYDSNGDLRTRTRTQTLYAEVVKPKPNYYYYTSLGYGNQAAPDLTFSRSPQHTEKLSEKEIAKKVKHGEKQLKKMTQKATKEGGSFQEMANTEFEVLFDALDRDQEVQYRLMFTPLAQRNMVSLVKSNTGYGDDFYFNKLRRFNVVTCEHAQNRTLDTSPANYYSYSVDIAKLNFLNFNTDYFKSLFFNFAPLMAVPAYIDEPCASMEIPEAFASNFTLYEHEVMANAFNPSVFAHPETATDTILKTEMVSKQGDKDNVAVTAYSYATVERVDYVPVYGGDGRYHDVPVPWIEYIPLVNITNMTVEQYNPDAVGTTSDISAHDEAYLHGVVAKILR